MSEIVRVLYRNHRGETNWRAIVPRQLWYGATEWHKEPQWLLKCLDADKNVERDFAMKDILRWSGDG